MHTKKGFRLGSRLKFICMGNTLIEAAIIPFSMMMAQLLSDLTAQALAGEAAIVVRSALLLIVLLVAVTIFQIISKICLRRYQARAENGCRIDFLEMFLQNSPNRIYKADHGELMENMNDDIGACVNCYTTSYPRMISGVASVLGYMIFLLVKNTTVACSLFAFSLIQFIPPLIIKKFMQVNYDKCRDIEAKITDHVMEAVNGFETIKLYGLKAWWQERMASYHREYLPAGHRADAIAAAQRGMYRTLDYILKFGTYALMGIYILLDFCSVEVAVQAIYLSGSIFTSAKMIFSEIPEIAVAVRAQKWINKWMPVFAHDALVYLDARRIELKNVCLDRGGEQILKEVNICFEADQNYMIEGENGTGKTTLFHLLTGIELPKSGEVVIEGAAQNTSACRISPKTLLYIPQMDPEFGFDAATLAAMFGSECQKNFRELVRRFGVAEERLKACKIRDLSGGERKKVFLAIGFAVHSQWLLLDEPTNNLDAHGVDVLQELSAARTGIIIISHNTVLRATVDHILRMENGRVHNEK